MAKTVLDKPVLLCLYGFPGSGKSYVARNIADSIQMAHVSADRIRSELFQQPRYDAQENAIVLHLMNYMTSEFLDAGVSVVYDFNAARSGQRRALRELAKKHKAEYLLVWLQIDTDSAFTRTQSRDRRTSDDRYAQPLDQISFDKVTSDMQNPQTNEPYMVISGKHSFVTQKNAIINKLYQMGLLSSETVQHNVAKPELINLIPNPYGGRVDMSRRNITIR
ncbi:MAG TPA: AAA family ATPase [Candidatus Saccharimonadales bacterium]|nr:AAA family ATPase [Candidatus Saccharimonadales bacterium]